MLKVLKISSTGIKEDAKRYYETEEIEKSKIGLMKDDALSLCWGTNRAEQEENPRIYLKAIRATLITLGFDENWVNGDFRDLYEEEHRSQFPSCDD